MRYFQSPPDSRKEDENGMSAFEVRRLVEEGRLDGDVLLYSEDRASSIPAHAVTSPKPPPLPPRTVPGASIPRKKQSLAWLWIVLGCFGLFIALTFGCVCLAVYFSHRAEDSILSEAPMMEEREAHEFRWVEPKDYQADGAPDQPDEEILRLVRYPTSAGAMAAYLTPDPEDGKKHPVMIWSKGRFGGIGDFLWDEPSRTNDQSARAFREAGIVLMCPSYRGENDNPGRFELFYGEVDDFLAAVEYAKSLPYVDPERVYIGGHSTGGTIALLVAASGVNCRGIFSFGGAPDMETVMADGEGYDNTPYDIESESDHQLRSAIRYTRYIKSPTFYIEGGVDSFYASDAKRMARIAKRNDIPFAAFFIRKGDHFDVLTPLTGLIAQKILEDEFDGPLITLNQEELDRAWDDINDISLSSELISWLSQGGDLETIINNLEDDAEVTSLDEITIIRDAVKKVDLETSDIAELAELCDQISSDDFTQVFVTEVGPLLRNYIKEVLNSDQERSELTEENCLRIMGTLAIANDQEIAPLVVKMAKEEFLPSNNNWEWVFDEVEGMSHSGKSILAAFRDDPPIGAVADQLMNSINHLMLEQKSDEDLEESEKLPYHPYNSEKGAARLEEMIDANGDELFQSTMSLAFVDQPFRERLLKKTLDHERQSIRMEAAWAGGWNGNVEGIKRLQELCLDLDQSVKAKQYLNELGLEDKIPEASLVSDFVAKSKMIKWLQHPKELSQSPESIKVIDSRKIFWPPTDKEISAWLFEFTYRFDEAKPFKTSYGMVGGTTWSSFTAYPENASVSDLYAHHCALELNWQDEDDKEVGVTKEIALKLLFEKNPGIAFPSAPAAIQ